MKITVIIGHPNYKKSIANKTVVQGLKNTEKLQFRNLIELYPNYDIDINTEQKILINTDLIIFQFPIYWASMPAILKLWIDEVFLNDFAFGTSYKLKNKKILVSATLSGVNNKESNENVLNKILFPFKGLANFCQIEYLEPIILYGMNYSLNKPRKYFIQKAVFHKDKILQTIKIIENENK